MNLSISASNNYYVSSVNQQKVEKNETTEVGKLIETKKEQTTENDTNNIYFNSNDDVINTEKNLEEIRNKMIR